jgi:tetratricopeptide (TPR) repeat protein
LPDAAYKVKLARLYFDRREAQAMPLAEEALQDRHLAAADRCAALFYVGVERLNRREFAKARDVFQQLVKLRRLSDDWVLLAECERVLGNGPAQISALQTAARVNPRLWKIHQQLADHFHRQGDLHTAEFHRQRAVP